MIDFSKLSKTWLVIAIVLIVVNIVGAVLAILTLKKSFWEMIVVAAVVVGDVIAYYFIYKNLKSAIIGTASGLSPPK